MNKSVETSIEVLCSFLYSEYDVVVQREPGLDNAYFPDVELVEIDALMCLEEQYHTLLHESSHIVLHPDKDETRAWQFAEQFVSSLELHTLTAGFFELKEHCIQTYSNQESL